MRVFEASKVFIFLAPRKNQVEHRRVDGHQRAQAFVNDDVHAVTISGQSTQQALEVVELMPLEGINTQGNAGTRVLEQTLQA